MGAARISFSFLTEHISTFLFKFHGSSYGFVTQMMYEREGKEYDEKDATIERDRKASKSERRNVSIYDGLD